jgi:hypothetical protein
MPNPLHLFGPPVIVLVSLPLAIFAIVTTTMAVIALTIRVSIIYVELGTALVHAYLFPPPLKPASKRPSRRSSYPNAFPNVPPDAMSSLDATTPATPSRLHKRSGSLASLIGTNGITRDFEGVGGWRDGGDDEEEALWMGMNSRLELPAATPKRNHRRSTTGGSVGHRRTWTPEVLRMSPRPSRARTPIYTCHEKQAVESYFPVQGNSDVRTLSRSDSMGKTELDAKRKKTSGSSSSSASSISKRPNSATKLAG